jgi:hypothetical protein
VELEKDGESNSRAGQDLCGRLRCGQLSHATPALGQCRTPDGLANGSGQVGRNYMVHNNTALMAIDPIRVNTTIFQKTMAVNDFYHSGPDFPFPMGNMQMLGKLQAGMLTAAKPGVPRPILQAMANRSVDWWIMSEDLPDPNNRVAGFGRPRARSLDAQ